MYIHARIRENRAGFFCGDLLVQIGHIKRRHTWEMRKGEEKEKTELSESFVGRRG